MYYTPSEHLPTDSFDQSSSPTSHQPPLSPLSEKNDTTIALQNKTFLEIEKDSPPSALPSPISSEPAESLIMGTESQPPSEPPCVNEDLDDTSSVHEYHNSWTQDTLGSVHSLAESKPITQECFQDYVLRMNVREQDKFKKQFRVS